MNRLKVLVIVFLMIFTLNTLSSMIFTEPIQEEKEVDLFNIDFNGGKIKTKNRYITWESLAGDKIHFYLIINDEIAEITSLELNPQGYSVTFDQVVLKFKNQGQNIKFDIINKFGNNRVDFVFNESFKIREADHLIIFDSNTFLDLTDSKDYIRAYFQGFQKTIIQYEMNGELVIDPIFSNDVLLDPITVTSIKQVNTTSVLAFSDNASESMVDQVEWNITWDFNDVITGIYNDPEALAKLDMLKNPSFEHNVSRHKDDSDEFDLTQNETDGDWFFSVQNPAETKNWLKMAGCAPKASWHTFMQGVYTGKCGLGLDLGEATPIDSYIEQDVFIPVDMITEFSYIKARFAGGGQEYLAQIFYNDSTQSTHATGASDIIDNHEAGNDDDEWKPTVVIIDNLTAGKFIEKIRFNFTNQGCNDCFFDHIQILTNQSNDFEFDLARSFKNRYLEGNGFAYLNRSNTQEDVFTINKSMLLRLDPYKAQMDVANSAVIYDELTKFIEPAGSDRFNQNESMLASYYTSIYNKINITFYVENAAGMSDLGIYILDYDKGAGLLEGLSGMPRCHDSSGDTSILSFTHPCLFWNVIGGNDIFWDTGYGGQGHTNSTMLGSTVLNSSQFGQYLTITLDLNDLSNQRSEFDNNSDFFWSFSQGLQLFINSSSNDLFHFRLDDMIIYKDLPVFITELAGFDIFYSISSFVRENIFRNETVSFNQAEWESSPNWDLLGWFNVTFDTNQQIQNLTSDLILSVNNNTANSFLTFNFTNDIIINGTKYNASFIIENQYDFLNSTLDGTDYTVLPAFIIETVINATHNEFKVTTWFENWTFYFFTNNSIGLFQIDLDDFLPSANTNITSVEFFARIEFNNGTAISSEVFYLNLYNSAGTTLLDSEQFTTNSSGVLESTMSFAILNSGTYALQLLHNASRMGNQVLTFGVQRDTTAPTISQIIFAPSNTPPPSKSVTVLVDLIDSTVGGTQESTAESALDIHLIGRANSKTQLVDVIQGSFSSGLWRFKVRGLPTGNSFFFRVVATDDFGNTVTGDLNEIKFGGSTAPSAGGEAGAGNGGDGAGIPRGIIAEDEGRGLSIPVIIAIVGGAVFVISVIVLIVRFFTTRQQPQFEIAVQVVPKGKTKLKIPKLK